ncbi:MAG TPA: PilZ domain-containing protein [Polyangia bacterium]
MPPSSQRAQPRVKYPADVRLFADRFEEPVAGRARDLGPTGIFVEADERLSIGTPVICEVTLPSGPVRLTGLVTREQSLVPKAQDAGDPETTEALVTPPNRVGMGIHFINVEDAVRAEIEALIPADERARPLVTLHLDGMKEALRSPAELTEDGANVIATLPALRQGNEIKLSFLSGAPSPTEGTSGARSVVRDVRLVEPGADGSPRLELRLQFMPPDAAGGKRTRTDYPPPGDATIEGIVRAANQAEAVANHDDDTEITAIHTPSGIAAASLGHIIMRDRALTKSTDRAAETPPVQLRAADIVKHRTRRVPTPAATAAPAAVKPQAQRDDDRILPSTTSRATRVAAVTAGALALVAVGVGLGQLVTTPRRQPTASPVSVDRASVVQAPPNQPSPAPTTAADEPAVRAGEAAAVPAPASEPPVAAVEAPPAATTAEPSPQAPREAPAAPPTGNAPAAQAPVTDEGSAQPAAPRQAMATAEATAGAGIQLLPVGTPGPDVIVNPGEITAVVPVTGSTAGAVKYPLTRPNGIAVDLPEAETSLPIGRHAVFNDGFRFVSIRPRAGGGIRVAFTYAYYTPRLLDVTVDDTAVRVRVAPPSRPAAP